MPGGLDLGTLTVKMAADVAGLKSDFVKAQAATQAAASAQAAQAAAAAQATMAAAATAIEAKLSKLGALVAAHDAKVQQAQAASAARAAAAASAEMATITRAAQAENAAFDAAKAKLAEEAALKAAAAAEERRHAEDSIAVADMAAQMKIKGVKAVGTAAEAEAGKLQSIEKRMKAGFAGETLVASVQRVSSAIQGLGGQFESLGRGISAAGLVVQGFFQGGLLGAGIAAVAAGIAYLAEEWTAAEKAAGEAAAALSRALDEQSAKLKTFADRVSEAAKQMVHAARMAKGMTAGQATAAGTAGLQKREWELSDKLATANEQIAAAQARLNVTGPAWAAAQEDGTSRLMPGEGRKREEIGALQAARDKIARELEEVSGEVSAILSEALAGDFVTKLGKATDKAAAAVDELAKQMKAYADTMLTNVFGDQVSTSQAAYESRRAGQGLGEMADPDSQHTQKETAARLKAAAELSLENAYETARYMAEIRQGNAQRATQLASSGAAAGGGGGGSGMYFGGGATGELMRGVEGAVKDWGGAISALGSLGQLVTATLSAVVSENPMQGIAQIIANLVQRSTPLRYILKLADEMITSLVESLTRFVEPFIPAISVLFKVVGAIGSFLGAILELAIAVAGGQQNMGFLFEALKIIGGAFNVAAATIKWIANAMKDVMLEAGQNVLRLGGPLFAQQIADMEAMKSGQKGFGETVGAAWSAFADLTSSGEMAAYNLFKAGDAAEKVAQSFLNLPAGFKIASAMYGATSASGEAWGGYAPPITNPAMPAVGGSNTGGDGGGSGGGSGGGDVFNFYGPITVNGDDSFRNKVTVSANQSGMATTGTPATRARYSSSPTPHAPSSQPPPYVPAP